MVDYSIGYLPLDIVLNLKYSCVNVINKPGIDMNAKKGVVAGFSAVWSCLFCAL
jgi:hypothetical protein